jgi:hypothetical protein
VTYTEKDFEKDLLKTINDCRNLAPDRFRAYHTFNSYGSAGGFPDWVFVGPGGVAFRENKTQTGKLSLAQQGWAGVFGIAGADFAVRRPEHLASGVYSRELAVIAGLMGR